MVLADSHKISPVSRYSGYYYVLAFYIYRAITFYGATFQMLLFDAKVNIVVLQPQPNKLGWFGLFPFRSPLLRKSFNYFLFLGVLRCFSSPRSLTASGILYLQYRGLPHSEIYGLQVMCTSP